jgi:chromosome partitioning protein
MKKIAITTFKGGTGKTTTTMNLGHGLALCGKRVLVIDCDPQGSLTVSFNFRAEATLSDLLLFRKAQIVRLRRNLYGIDSGGERLVEAQHLLAKGNGNELRLKKILTYLRECDYVLFDCAPALNLVSVNVLLSADHVLLPVSTDFLALVGVKLTLETLDDIGRDYRHKPELLGILPTFFDSRTKISKEVLSILKEHFGDKVFETYIRVNTQLKESPSFHKTIFEYAPSSAGSEDYFSLTEEILERTGDSYGRDKNIGQ